MEGDDEPRGGIATQTEIGIAEYIHGVSVREITGKVTDNDAVLHGVVDGAELLSNGCLGEGRIDTVDPGRPQTWKK